MVSSWGAQNPLIECVPNVSEGRDAAVIRRLADAVVAGGARLIDVHRDVDHHRSVFTMVGETETVERSTLALAHAAVELIDLRTHRGAHPRIGAIDVIPFVPLRGSTMRDAVAAAHRLGSIFARECHVPVFFYAEAASRQSRRELSAVRKGGFECLSERLCAPEGQPDAGPSTPHPSAGATAVGARGPLIAFNAVLDTDDREAANAIARAIRESSGGFPGVQAMGVTLTSRGLTQVSMNVLDYRRTSPSVISERVETEARRRGIAVREYELVGCAPGGIFDAWPPTLAPIVGLKASQVLEPALVSDS